MYASAYTSASGSARTSGEDESRTRLYPSYYPAYTSPSAWSSSPSSSDDRPLHMYRSTMYQVGVDEDGVPRTPSLDSSGSKKPPRRRRSTKKLKKNRMEDMYQHEEEEADNIPLPTPFAAMLADRDDPMEETKPYVPDEVYVSFFVFSWDWVLTDDPADHHAHTCSTVNTLLCRCGSALAYITSSGE
jgi:hypothetical protein